MSPQQVLESYVRAVARNLNPGKARAEVAQELRVQLADELAGRAAETGRPADAAMALEIARSFGRPEDLAAQYQAPFAIIEPSETHRFLVFVVIGYGIFATVVETLRRLGSEAAADYDLNAVTWIGLATIIFGIRAWWRRTNPRFDEWRPAERLVDLDRVRYGSLAVSAALVALMLLAYLWPGPLVELLSAGRISAADLAYDPNFTDPHALRFPWLVGVLVAFLGLYAYVAIRKRWSRVTRWLRIFLLLHLALQLGWHMVYPAPVFASPATEAVVFPILSVIISVIGVDLWLHVLAEWDWIEPPRAAAPA